MSEITESRPVVDEEQHYHEAALGSLWWGSRIGIALGLTAFGGIIFAYFYLRSLNSHGLWDPHGITASTLMGALILTLVLVSVILNQFGNVRLRKGSTLDWQVANVASLLGGLFAAGFQIWEMTRLNFQPGSSGYAGVYTAFGPVYALILILSMYWLETLIARSFRSAKLFVEEGGVGFSNLPQAENFRAGLEGFSYYWVFFGIASVVFFILFYVL